MHAWSTEYFAALTPPKYLQIVESEALRMFISHLYLEECRKRFRSSHWTHWSIGQRRVSLAPRFCLLLLFVWNSQRKIALFFHAARSAAVKRLDRRSETLQGSVCSSTQNTALILFWNSIRVGSTRVLSLRNRTVNAVRDGRMNEMIVDHKWVFYAKEEFKRIRPFKNCLNSQNQNSGMDKNTQMLNILRPLLFSFYFLHF